MTALVLIALDRHLDGAPRQAFAVGFFAALDRPELWLLWGPYGLYLWWKDPGARKLVIGAVRADPGALVPARAVGIGAPVPRRHPRAAPPLEQRRVRQVPVLHRAHASTRGRG